jgi:hypothetical protein
MQYTLQKWIQNLGELDLRVDSITADLNGKWRESGIQRRGHETVRNSVINFGVMKIRKFWAMKNCHRFNKDSVPWNKSRLLKRER